MEENKVAAMKPHAIMITFPSQGHLNPFVRLATKLASEGFAVTFVNSEYNHHLISKSHKNNESDIFSDARDSGLDIRYATISDGFPLEYDRKVNGLEYLQYFMNEFPSSVDKFVGNLIQESPSSLVPIMVADTLASWPRLIASKYNMVNVSFWTGPAVAFALNSYMDLLIKHDHFPPSGNDQDFLIDYLPGVDPLRPQDLSSHLREPPTKFIHEALFKLFENVKTADFVLLNTVQELESHTLSALNQIHPAYAIGPINFSTRINVSNSLLSETDCIEWLNSKLPGSVLYVSFGSGAGQTKREAIEEIAKGLHLSKVNFLWIIRQQIVEGEINDHVLPVGFEDDVKDRGLIVEWCNQTAVLSHPSIGGFLTHCGWNSISESMWFGVPMICYPITYDQPTNRKLVVDDWKIGINLSNDGAAVDGEHVAMKIKELMSRETSDGVRNEMKKFKKMMHDALAKDGSSERNFGKFFKDLKDKIMHQQQEKCMTT